MAWTVLYGQRPRSPKQTPQWQPSKLLQTALRARLTIRNGMSYGTGARAERLWPLLHPFFHNVRCLSLNDLETMNPEAGFRHSC